jgi:two-component system, probable response regulator PhcQ
MDKTYDYKKFAVLYVDDEEKSLKNFERAFGDQFRILTAAGAQQGLKLLEEHKDGVAILMTDQRMPGEKGVWLLEHARQLRPRVIRILATAYADMEAAISAVNAGSIYRYITKPWNPVELEALLKRALEFFMVRQERDQLLKEKISVLHNIMIADRVLSLGLLTAGLSHHIRNSLVAVKTFLDLAPTKLQEENLDLQNLRNPDFWRDYHRSVQSQIERINNMLKDLWVASEKPAFEFNDTVRLAEVLAGVLALLKDKLAAKNIQIEMRLSDSLPALQVDRRKFSRLFELLLEDEIVSLPAGSRIWISAQDPEGESPGQAIRVEVRDNGPGMPKDALRLIFDPFAVRSDSPLEYGIRLMACFFIVHHHGGKIVAQSQEQKGTTFVLKLPVNPTALPPPEEMQGFLQRVLLNDALWEKLLASF